MQRRVTAIALWIVASGLLAASCMISPKPEPPTATLDIDRISRFGPVFGVEIIGEAGAAAPAGALVRVTPLDSALDPAEAAIEPDGSFRLEVPAEEGEEVRLQVVSELARSAPVDAILGPPDAALLPADRPLWSCLLLGPAAELDLGEHDRVVVESSCAHDVEIGEPALRRPTAGVEVGRGQSWPVALAPGEGVDVVVQVEPGVEGEEVFFIEATAPERDRRPVTVLFP